MNRYDARLPSMIRACGRAGCPSWRDIQIDLLPTSIPAGCRCFDRGIGQTGVQEQLREGIAIVHAIAHLTGGQPEPADRQCLQPPRSEQPGKHQPPNSGLEPLKHAAR